jgi:transcription initiation factor TFIIE subunit beta
MSNPLLANLNAFRSKVKSAPVLPQNSKKQTPSSASTSSTSLNTVSTPKRALEEDDDFNDDDLDSDAHKRQMLNAAGSHLSTKLLLAVEYVKDRNAVVPVSQLTSYLNLNNPEQQAKLLSLIKNLEKIKYNPTDNSLEYVSIHNIKSKDELLQFLRTRATFKGIAVKELKDGWNGCFDAINELEEESKVLVLRTKKDGAPRLVWANIGGELGAVDEEFVKIWLGVKLPDPAELPGKLNKLGLKPASVDPATIKKEGDGTVLKKRKSRKGKITNVHMAGILKDYSNM